MRTSHLPRVDLTRLTRSQVSALLNMSPREVAKLDGRQLHPTRSSDRTWRYDCAEVRALLAPGSFGHTFDAKGHGIDGDMTAKVFQHFLKRTPLAKVAVETKQTAQALQYLRAQYDELRGSITLPRKVIVELKDLVCQNFSTAPALLSAVRFALQARFEEGRADAHDFGQILDQTTGQLRPVSPPGSAAALGETTPTIAIEGGQPL